MADLTPIQKQMAENEERVFEAIKANEGLETFDSLRMKLGMSMGELSAALYGLDQDQGRIEQSSNDVFSCYFSLKRK